MSGGNELQNKSLCYENSHLIEAEKLKRIKEIIEKPIASNIKVSMIEEVLKA